MGRPRRALNDCPFATLFKSFFEQLFTSESVTSDDHLRTAIVGVLAFVITPGVVLLLEVFPEYQSAVIRVKVLHAPTALIDDLLEWIVLILVTYSMVTVGLVATAVWDALTFDRRDAMMLGPFVPGCSRAARRTCVGLCWAVERSEKQDGAPS